MKDKELKLNASGYYDEPCYKAITANPKPGEIWIHNQSGAYMLVMANVNGVCPTFRLNEQEREGCITVTCKVPMYTHPAFMGYVFETNLSQYVKTAKEEEFKAVKQALANVLGFHEGKATLNMTTDGTVAMPYDNTNEELRNERDAMLRRVQALEDERIKLNYEIEAREKANALLNESLTKVSGEADKAGIYKEMYMTLLDKVIAVRGCV